MKPIADRLVTYADDKKVIHFNNITDSGLRRIVRDDRVLGGLRESLQEIDPQLELYIPRKVDSREKQLKRQIQAKFGTHIDLTDMYRNEKTYYRKIQIYGRPSEVVTRWGLTYSYSKHYPVHDFGVRLDELAENGIIEGLLKKDRKLYHALYTKARRQDITIEEYVEGLGYILKR